MRSRLAVTTLVAFVGLLASGAARADPPSEFVPKDPAAKVSLMLEDAELGELVRTIGELTGKRFVVATSKAKSLKATIFSPQKITPAEAYAAFLAVLQSNGLTVLPDGPLNKIVDAQDISKQATPVAKVGEAPTGEERYVTRIVRLSHVSAEEVAGNVLSKFQSRDGSIVPYPPGNLLILTDTGDNLRRMARILEDVDVGGAKDQVWFEPVHYLAAAELGHRLGEVFDLGVGEASVSSSKQAAPAASASTEAHVAKIVPIERPNALVIVASDGGYKRLLELIKLIDVPSSGESEIHVVPLAYADAKKIVPALNDSLAGGAASSGAGAAPSNKGGLGVPAPVLEQPAKISAEETTNSILITASARDYAAIREVVRQIDKPRRQVFIDAVVMDVSMTRSTSLGVSYHGAGSGTSDGSLMYGGLNALTSVTAPKVDDPTTLQGLALGIRGPGIPGSDSLLGITIPQFGVLLTALALANDTDVLSTPHILASDNTPAEIKVQLNTSLQKNAPTFQLPTGGATAVPTVTGTPRYAQLGPRIKVTPHLNDSDEVRLDIEETISDSNGVDANSSLGTLSFTERDAATTLTVKDQQTVVIGGLVRDKVTHTESKIPILGDIPVLGALFRSSGSQVEKGNLILVLTPYIIRDQEDLRLVFERKMQERQEFLDHYMVFSDHSYEAPRDWSRTKGLLGVIHGEYKAVEQRRALADLAKPAPPKTHEGVTPIDLPATNNANNARAGATPLPKPPPAAPAAVERVER